jgi:VWFA-related protein
MNFVTLVKRNQVAARVVAAGFALLVATFARAQSPPAKGLAPQNKQSPGKSAPTLPVIRVNTRIVNIDVIVRDRRGNSVEDLKQSDFKVYDNGQLQRIEFLDKFSDGVSASPSPGALPPKLPPNIFTNFPGQDASLPVNLTIILADALNTPFGDQVYANKQLLKCIENLKPQDHVALYALGNGLRILQDFTGDDALLVRAAKAYMGQNTLAEPASELNSSQVNLPFSPSAQAQVRLQQIMLKMEQMNEQVGDFYQERRTEMTLAAFRTIALHVAGVPGRKNLLWLSGSFPVTFGLENTVLPASALTGPKPQLNNSPLAPAPQTYGELFEDAQRLLESANVAVYPVDAMGLEAPYSVPTSPNAAMPDTDVYPHNEEAHMVMAQIANNTGGEAYFNTNDMADALERAMDDSRFSYLLGFAPQIQWNGKFHKVQVRVDRGGLSVRARKGYYAFPARTYAPQELNVLAYEAQESRLDAMQVPVEVAVKVAHPKTSSANAVLDLAVFVPGKRVEFNEIPGQREADLDYAVAQRNANDRILRKYETGYRFRLGAEAYQAAMQGGLTYHETVVLDPQTTNLKVVVYDYGRHAFGSTTVPIYRIQGLRQSTAD